jgi:hypothetical protein
MSADASIDLELNAKQLYSELQVAERKYTQGMDRIGQGTNRAGNAMDGIKVKTKAAGRAIHNFAEDMANGADAATLLQDGIMGVGKSLGLSLGALAGVMVGAVVVDKILSAQKELKLLDDEFKKLTAPGPGAQFQTLESLEQHINQVVAARQKLIDQNKDWSAGAIADDAIKGGNFLNPIASFFGSRGKKKDQIAGYYATEESDLAGILNKRRSRSGLRDGALNGESDSTTKAKLAQIETDEKLGKARSLDEMAQLFAELDLTFREMAAAIAAKRRDRVQQTLGELAAIPEVATSSDSYERWQAGQKARQAQAWDAEGESRRSRGDMAGAQEAFNYSSDIKRSIPGLKDSEKDLKDEFRGALDESAVLKDIRTNTSGMFKGR